MKNRHKTRKKWWTRELKMLKAEVDQLYKLNKKAIKDNINKDLHKANYKRKKKEFRTYQRTWVHNKQLKVDFNTNKLLKANKTQFWKHMEKNRKNKTSMTYTVIYSYDLYCYVRMNLIS